MTTHGESLTYEDLQKAVDIVARLRGQEQSVLTHLGRTVLEGAAAAEIERLRAALAEEKIKTDMLYMEGQDCVNRIRELENALAEAQEVIKKAGATFELAYE